MINVVTDVMLPISGEVTYMRIYAKQNDSKTRYLRVTLIDKTGAAVSASGEGHVAYIRATKPDKTQIFDTCTIDENGKVIALLSQQFLACSGVVKTDIAIYSNNEEILSSSSFDVEVEKSSCDENEIVSSDEFTALTEALTEAMNAEAIAKKTVARLTDALGTEGSTNRFPIDKGTVLEPVVYEATAGEFIVSQADYQQGVDSFIGYYGTSDSTLEIRDEYKAFFNYGYHLSDESPFLFSELAQEEYALSFDVIEGESFLDVADFFFEVYEKSLDSSAIYGDLIATCTGSDVYFEVTATKPLITILAVAKLHDGESWVGDYIAVKPFLRRKAFVAAEYDRYEPSVIKRISEDNTKLQTEINEFKAANDNYLTPTYEGTLPLAVDGGAGGYADDWTIFGNDHYNPDSHNLLELAESSMTKFGLTFTVDNEAGTITVDGTVTGVETSASVYFLIHAAAGKHYLTGCPSGLTGCYASMRYPGSGTPLGPSVTNWDSSVTAMDTGDGDVEVLLIEGNNYLYYELNVLRGASFDNVVFRPMIRRSDASPDFEPYTVGVGERTKNFVRAVVGATSQSITFTVDHDAGTVTANGTATGSAQFRIGINDPEDSNNIIVPPGNYYFSGTPSGGSGNSYNCYSWDRDTNSRSKQWDGTTNVETDLGQGSCQVQITGHRQGITLRIAQGYTANNLVFKPMLRREDTTPDFEPYGYKIPIVSNNETTDIFIGSSPLTSGKKVTKAIAGAEIPLKAGVNVVDTSLFNKPRVDVKVDRLKNIEQALAGGGGSTLITRAITNNGTYRAIDDEADGYSSVDVDVPDYNETQTDTAMDAVEEVTQ